MLIKKIIVKNYRSLENAIFYPKGILSLVGRNSSGKSNVIKALELFFETSTKLLNRDSFFNHNTESPIEMFVTFTSLSNWEKEQFGPWTDGVDLTVGRRITCTGIDSYNISNIAVIKVPDIEWLREENINGENITKWWNNKDTLAMNGIDFASYFNDKKPKVNEWKDAAKKFCVEHEKKIPFITQEVENPKGYPNVLKGALPEFVYIPAVRDISDEAKVAKTNPFGQLINSVIEKISAQQKEMVSEQIKELGKMLNRNEEGKRIEEIKRIEDRLNKLMEDLMKCDIEIEMPMPELREVFGSAKIYAHDGIRTTIEAKGHGLQRSMIFTILRAYAEFSHVIKAGEKANERSTIFAIEEPELYLHPQAQRTLMNVFRQISKNGDQIIYATQSNLFVDIEYFDEICIMKRVKDGEVYKSYPTQLTIKDLLDDLKIRKNIDGTDEAIRELYSHAFNPMINEGFFADKVIIVEGPSELYILPIYAKLLECDFDKENISVVYSGGKGPMDRLLRVFNGFKLPTYILFDGDKNNSDTEIKNKTLELLNLLGSPLKDIGVLQTKVEDEFAVIDTKLEDLMKREIKDYEQLLEKATKSLGPVGKPLKHRHIAKQIKEKINTNPDSDLIPKTIKDIVSKIRILKYNKSYLKRFAKGTGTE